MADQIEMLVSLYESGGISRRGFLASLAALTAAPGAASAKPQGFAGKSLNHVTLAVSDVDQSRQFYERVLGISVVSEQSNGLNLGLGDSFLGLYDINNQIGINHFCVGIDDYTVESAAAQLRTLGIEPYVRPDKPEVYFQDPDGITVQLEDKSYRG